MLGSLRNSISGDLSALMGLPREIVSLELLLMFLVKVFRPSDPNYWKNVEWIPYVFSKEYCSECQTI